LIRDVRLKFGVLFGRGKSILGGNQQGVIKNILEVGCSKEKFSPEYQAILGF
jgi:hypothetical protein